LRVALGERLQRLGQRPAAVVLTGEDRARQEELAYELERRLWDDGYTAHLLGAREVGALGVCQRLGLITIVLADGSTELPALGRVVGPEQLVVVECDASASVDRVLRELKSRDVVR
jgi:bifunctional enzyme CysN/CysC